MGKVIIGLLALLAALWLLWPKTKATAAAPATAITPTATAAKAATPKDTRVTLLSPLIGTPSLPAQAAPAVVVTDVVTSQLAIMPDAEALAVQISAAAASGQATRTPTLDTTIDVPSVVAAAAATGQTVESWLNNNAGGSLQYQGLPSDPAAKANLIADYVAAQQSGLQKVNSSPLGWANPALTPAERSAASGMPVENWIPYYA